MRRGSTRSPLRCCYRPIGADEAFKSFKKEPIPILDMQILFISTGAGFVLFQLLVLLAVLNGSRKSTPKFERGSPFTITDKRDEAQELVATGGEGTAEPR